MAWLDAFANSAMGASPPQQGNDILVYLLQPSRRPGVLRVEFVITRLLKRGGLGKGRKAHLYNIASAFHYVGYIQEADRQIAKLLGADLEYGQSDVLLRGDLGFLALTKMLQTGRCFWLGVERPPLLFGEQRPLHVQWQRDPEGNAQLQLQVEPAGQVLVTEPGLYLDPDTASVGPLTGVPYNARQLESLLLAPTVPGRLVGQFSQRLMQAIDATLLPPPQATEVREVSGENARPCINLVATDAGGRRYHYLRLRFAYAGREIPALPEAEVYTHVEAERLIRIWRKLDQEHAAVARLEALGFSAQLDPQQRELIFLSLGEHAAMEGATRWSHFLAETLPQLQQEGWRVTYDDSFHLQFHEAGDWTAAVEEEDNDWFGLRFSIEIDHQPVALLPLVAQLLEHYEPHQLPDTLSLPLGESRYLNIASAQIRPILETLYELYDTDGLQPDGALRLSRFDAGRLAELETRGGGHLHWQGGEPLRTLGRRLQDFQGIEPVAPPAGLQATLRPYQQQGLNWLQFLRQYGFGGILADDMGLGKTVQTLAHLLREKEEGRMDRPCLIVAPTSLMGNWRREAQQFAPALKVLVLQGLDRHTRFDLIHDHDLVLSTYPLLSRDADQLLAHQYHMLILDEAQVVKNPRAQAAQTIRRIDTRHRLCLTGTPMENHLGELWALFDFLMPGFLGDMRQFTTLFRTPIEKHGDGERRQRLARRVAPFMLRRSKQEVARELPEKNEFQLTVGLGQKQAALYESIRLAMEEKVRKAIASKGLARSHITILDALLKLRQVCCDPRLLSLSQARSVQESAKLEVLMGMLPEMLEEGRRVLLFSQFTQMLGHIEAELIKLGIRYSKLTGQTRNRDEVIERFKSGRAQVFLISLKAGGVGLNLTEADTVIHYDPWWNPAAENQATDRAYRIGQDKAVFVYKLVTENSVEEKIVAMQARKQRLADGVYDKEPQGEDLQLNQEDLAQLFAPL